MCAIAGILGLSFSDSTVKQMLDTMRRRGPDDTGVYMSPQIALLHARLAVIDFAGGVQPMQLEHHGVNYCIVYNGELYNTEEIRKKLITKGHRFIGHSDTEVVLHAVAEWGENALDIFNGIFAFAVWNEQEKSLFLARDRMGVKPLFYKLHGGGLLFASEIKTILKYPTVHAELDCDGVGEILLLGPGRTPGSGVLRGVRELEPGFCATYKNGKLNVRQYWHLKDREHTDDFETTVEYVRYLVTDSIKRQMVSDVPIGTFLSGGLDSSLITSVCSQELKKRGEILNTFSVDYENNDKYFVSNKFQPNSDGEFILKMQDYLHTDHHFCVLKPEDLVDGILDATYARDLPGMADVDFSLLKFCGEIRRKVKVALSGECADEIFGGYPWYRDAEIRNADGFPWAQNTMERATFLGDAYKGKIDAFAFVKDRYDATISTCDILPSNTSDERRMKEMVNLNYKWFMQTLLDRKDRMSMYHGLEVRVPFCDYRIAEYLYAVPWVFKDYEGREKGLLRYAMRGYLPDAVLYRKKSPYPKTYDPKYLELVSDMLKDLLASADEPIHQIVNRTALENLLTANFKWPWYGQLMRVPQTIAYMLQINIWLKTYQVDIIA